MIVLDFDLIRLPYPSIKLKGILRRPHVMRSINANHALVAQNSPKAKTSSLRSLRPIHTNVTTLHLAQISEQEAPFEVLVRMRDRVKIRRRPK